MKKPLPPLLFMAGVLLASLPALAGEGEIPNPAAGWDALWNEVMIDLLAIGAIFGIAAAYMLIKYRAKSPTDVGSGPKLSKAQAVGWALIPVAIFLADDFYLGANGWSLWNDYRRIPENAMEVKVTGYQWYWEFEYENGVVTDELTVPVGRPVVLRMTSEDVIHSFGMPKYRVTEDLMPGRITYIWFNPVEAGETVATCREFCGLAHANMYTTVIALPPVEFEEWMAGEKAEAEEGETEAEGEKD
ncbi:MAG: cytochrome c oxidase subunit II [Rhodospirillales bacterium]